MPSLILCLRTDNLMPSCKAQFGQNTQKIDEITLTKKILNCELSDNREMTRDSNNGSDFLKTKFHQSHHLILCQSDREIKTLSLKNSSFWHLASLATQIKL